MLQMAAPVLPCQLQKSMCKSFQAARRQNGRATSSMMMWAQAVKRGLMVGAKLRWQSLGLNLTSETHQREPRREQMKSMLRNWQRLRIVNRGSRIVTSRGTPVRHCPTRSRKRTRPWIHTAGPQASNSFSSTLIEMSVERDAIFACPSARS